MKKTRKENVACDPFAAAQYFHFVIRLVIHTLFKVDVTKFGVKASVGILGEIAGYVSNKCMMG